MSAQTLRSYFESDIQQRLALDAVAREGWLDPGRDLDFYEETWRAFDPSSSADEAFGAFENIYGELKGFVFDRLGVRGGQRRGHLGGTSGGHAAGRRWRPVALSRLSAWKPSPKRRSERVGRFSASCQTGLD